MEKMHAVGESLEKMVYCKPVIHVVKLEATDIICTSTPQVTVSDPWGSNKEEEW